MALFAKQNRPAIGIPKPPNKTGVNNVVNIQAAAGYVNPQTNFNAIADSASRNQAMSIPAISRSRDLLASVVAGVPLVMYKKVWNGKKYDQVPIEPYAWLEQINPDVPNAHILAWTFEDAFFHGRAMWWVSSRYKIGGLPATFQRIPIAGISTPGNIGPMFNEPADEISYNGHNLDTKNVIQFLSPVEGILYQSPNVINIALKLEQARLKNSTASQPAGVLRQVEGDPLGAQDLTNLAQAFNQARMNNQTAAINKSVTYTETAGTPDKMMLIASSDYTALDCARLTNVPGFLLGLATGSYSYISSPQARADLYAFGAKPYMEMIAQTLSTNAVTAPGDYIKFDIESYLNEIQPTPAPTPKVEP